MKKLIAIATIALIATGAASAAKAESQLGLKGITFDLSTVSYAGGGIGLGARANFGQIADNVHLDTRLVFWRSSVDYGFWDVSLRDISIQPGVTYSFPLNNSKITPFVNGGVSLNFVSASASSDVYSTDADIWAGTYFGAQVGGGADYAINDRMAVGAGLTLHAGSMSYTEFGVRFTLGFGQ